MGGCQICGKHVDLYQSRCVQRTKTQTFGVNRRNSTMEAVSWVCDGIFDDHEWVSEFSLKLQETNMLEALICDIEVSCVVRWETLWFLAPTSLKNDLLSDGVVLEQHNETVDWAFQSAFVLPYWRVHTPRFLHEVNTCNVGRHDGVGLGPREGFLKLGTGRTT